MSGPFLDWAEAVLDGAVWQGIRYLSFDAGVPGFEAVVTVHLARAAAGLVADDVLVEGGESITDLAFEVAFSAADAIEVRFPVRGDRTPYVIRLATGGINPVHPFFDRASFNFYIDCPASDCRPLGEGAPVAAPPRPAVDLKTKDYAGFVAVLADWIKVRSPDWGDLAPASFERMLVELLSHHADHLSYLQDRVANEAFIDTARERHALRQHGLLLGYDLADGRAARTVVGFDVANPGVLPADVVVDYAGGEGEASLVYTTEAPVRLDPRHNAGSLTPAAFPGAASATLPRGATDLLLFGHDLGLTPGQRLSFKQGDRAAIVEVAEAAELQLPGWTASPADPPTAALGDVTRIALRRPLGAALRPWAEPLVIRGNLVDAVHGTPRRAVASPTGAVPPGALPIPLTRRTSIVAPRRLADGSLVWLLRALKLPEGPILFEDDGSGGTRPMLDVTVDGEPWSREDHLWESRSYDLHYVAESDDAGAIWLQFGDGVHGREIEAARTGPFAARSAVEIAVRYRIGAAPAGNCAGETLNRVPPAPPGSPLAAALTALGVTAVANVVPGTGGAAAETMDAARFAIPESLRHGPRRRAVTLADYAEGARIDGVARATALNLGGVFNTVQVLVDPIGQGSLPAALRQAVDRRVDELRMAGREHRVAAPAYVPLEVSLAVCAAAPRLRPAVRTRVLAALRPGEGGGYFHPDRLSFGQSPMLGDLLAFVHGIPGVRSVKALAFRRLDDASLVRVRDVIAVGPLEVARLDADDNRPENGVLEVLVVGLDDVDETEFDIGGPPADPLETGAPP